MKKPVIAIGIDAADSQLLNKWMSQGYLSSFSKFRSQGSYCDLSSNASYCNSPEVCTTTEALWTMFSTGCKPQKTGYWEITSYYPDTYEIHSGLTDCEYDHQEFPPFYALGDYFNVATMNVPGTALSDQVNGVQVIGWSGHYPGVSSRSKPPEALESIILQYGQNPILFKDNGIWWNSRYIEWERQAIKKSVRMHSEIYRDFLKNKSWDLFLAVFPELHTAGHDLYAHSMPDHPLYKHLHRGKYSTVNLLREAYQEVDQAVGEILQEAPDDAYVLIFSPHGMGPNFSDLLTQLFLPEILYRFSFPGKVAISPGELDGHLKPPITRPIRNGWTGETWVNLYEPNALKKFLKKWAPKQFLTGSNQGLRSPYAIAAKETAHGWMPAMWFQPLWPQMKAFALPGFAHGNIRINLRGREKEGIIEPEEYETLCSEIAEFLYRLRNGRDGQPVVKKVIRTRKCPTDSHPKLPQPDIVVHWNENITDVIDSPDFGRIGPVTYFRAGSHRHQGFCMLKGPGITPGSDLPTAEVVDLPPTILELMNAQIRDYFDGKSLLSSFQKTQLKN